MTPLYAGIDGVVRELTEMDAGINGVVKPMTEMWAGVSGVERQIFSAGGTIYGAEWDGSSNPKWTRTDAAANFADPNPAVNNGTGSSPFDDIMPWSGMQIYEDLYLGTLVAIPKYYYKWTRSGVAMKLQISPEQQDGFLVSPAHADRGDGKGERDTVYVARYHSSYFGQSITNRAPRTEITRSSARSILHNLHSDSWQYDFAMYWTIMMLYLVEYANWNSQAVIGYGCSPSGSVFNTGLTDSMIYHTGTTAANRTTYGCCQYRHIEGLWDNVYDWVDGIYFDSNKAFCIKNPQNFSDTSGGTYVGESNVSVIGERIESFTYPDVSGFEYALIPITKTYDYTDFNAYVCDNALGRGPGEVVCVGGYYLQKNDNGAFSFNFFNVASYSEPYIGSRLMKLP